MTFQADTANHDLIVRSSEGLYRHLVGTSGSSINRFEIVTWPGYLAFVGDRGDYVFKRTPDMLSFMDDGPEVPEYMAEKCVSCGHEGVWEFDRQEFSDNALWCADRDEDALDFLRNSVFPIRDESSESLLRSMLHDYGAPFEDFGAFSCRNLTTHFLWCLEAIAWTAKKLKELTDG